MTRGQVSSSEDKVGKNQRRKLGRQIWTDNPGLDVVHPNAAGIDVGNSEHYVAIASEKSDRAGAEVRMLYQRSSEPCTVSKSARNSLGRDAVNRSVLDSAVRRPGRRGSRWLT